MVIELKVFRKNYKELAEKAKLAFHNIKDKVKLVVSDFKNSERDVLGAAALAWTVKEYSLFK